MERQTKTQRIIDETKDTFSSFHPVTVRRVYYQLVLRQVVENNLSDYQSVSDVLANAQQEGLISWDWTGN